MADATYMPKTYRDKGGNRINVVSGGALNVEAGSTASIASSLTLSGGGALSGTFSGNPTFSGTPVFSGTVDLNGSLLFPVLSVSTGGAAITNNGVTVLSATAGTTVVYAMSAPVTGCIKILVGTKDGGSTSQTVSTTGAGATIGTTGITKIAFKNAEQAAVLVGGSTVIWHLAATYGSPVLS